MLSAAVKGGRPPTPGAPGVCAVTAPAALFWLQASYRRTLQCPFLELPGLLPQNLYTNYPQFGAR